VAVFSPLLDVLADVPDPRRAEGKLYKLPHVLLFSILAIVAGCNWRWCRNQRFAGLGRASGGGMGLRSPLWTLDALQIQ